MRAWQLAASVPWAMRPEMVETLLEVAARESAGPEAVAAKLGRPLENTRTVTLRDGVAVAPVVGPIFRRANLLTQISGATSVELLARDLTEACANPAVSAVLLDVDSPGGEANGVGELAGLIQELRAKKPIHAYAGGQVCSGAYWLAAACETITIGETAQGGSIGVVAVHRKDRDSRSVEFVSSQSPMKRPDLETDEGKAAVQRVVDDIAAVFIRDVARYRGVSEDTVLSDFGRGGVMVGQGAVDAGLADGLGTFEGVVARLAAEGQRKRRGTGKETRMEAVEEREGAEVEEQSAAAAAAAAGAEVEQLRRELEQATHRVTALEGREALLLAEQARREVTDSLSAMRFGELEQALAPTCRTALVEALMPLEAAQRTAVLAAVKGQQFVSLGERGFAPAEDAAETLTASEEQSLRAMAERNRLPFEEVKAHFLEVRKRRAA